MALLLSLWQCLTAPPPSIPVPPASTTSLHIPPPSSQVDYYTYVSSCLLDVGSVPRAQRLSRPYRDYLAGLVSYLESFYARTQPLAQLDKQYAKVSHGRVVVVLLGIDPPAAVWLPQAQPGPRSVGQLHLLLSAWLA